MYTINLCVQLLLYKFYYIYKLKEINNIIKITEEIILLYKVLGFICLNLKISLTTKLFQFSFIGKLSICPVMVLGYYDFKFNPWDSFRLFFLISIPFNTVPIEARGATAIDDIRC